MDFLTLDEYLVGARKIMLAQKCGYLVNDEDAVSHVAYRMMLADQTWNGKSERGTWRYNQAKYAILRIIGQRKKEKQRNIKSLDYGWDSVGDNSGLSLVETLEDPRSQTNNTLQQYNEVCECASKHLKGRQLECFTMYYQDGLSMEAIGKQLGCTRANVSLHVIKGTNEVKKCILRQG